MSKRLEREIDGYVVLAPNELNELIIEGTQLRYCVSGNHYKVTFSFSLVEVMMKEIGGLTQGHSVVICLNTKNEMAYISTTFVGSLNQSIAHPREILQRALLSNVA